jgi:uncharacterized protein (TIRG00374 family)
MGRQISPWKIILSVTLALVLLAFFLYQAPLAEVGLALKDVHVGWVLLTTVVALLTYFLRSLRWGLILRPAGKASTGALFGCTAAGFATSAILPARAGELVRPLLLSARTRIPAAATLASILTERLLDGASVLILFALSILVAGSELPATHLLLLQRAAVLAGLGVVGAVLLVVLLLRHREGAIRRVAGLVPVRFRSRAESFLSHLLEGLAVLGNPRRLVEITLWSMGLWLVIGLQLVALARAFAMPLSLPESFIVIAVSVIGLAVPTPAGVGGFHTAIQIALTQLLGLAAASATAYALLHHAICFFPITIVGLAYMAATGVSLGRARELAGDEPPAED